MRVAEKIELSLEVERQLQILSTHDSAGGGIQRRANAILLAARGWQNKDIAVETHLHKSVVGRWRRRFILGGIQALTRPPARPPRRTSPSDQNESRILSATLNERPPSASQWSTRTLASHLGLKAAMIGRVWTRNKLKPHLQRTFELAPESRIDPDLVDVVGVFLHPAKNAIALSCDEKGLGRKTTCKVSGLPLQRGRALTMANYYKRNGKLPLFSALNAVANCSGSPRQLLLADWLLFLETIDRKTPQGLRLYLIEDGNLGHRLSGLQEWLLAHTRLVLHVMPTSAAWLRIFELLYRELLSRQAPPEVNNRVANLKSAISRYIANDNKDGEAIVWTLKTAR